jgi:hypothetical protein
MQQNIFRKEKKRRFIKIDNEFLNYKNISWRAKGLHTYILSKPDNWKVIIKAVANFHNRGFQYISSAKKELIENNLWYCEKIRNDRGKFLENVTLVFDSPFSNINKQDLYSKNRIHRTNSNKNYTLMNCHHLDDENLSLEAKGIHSYILSKPNNWNISIKEIIRLGTESEHVVRKAVNELISNNYWQRYPVYGENIDNWKIEVYEEPFLESEKIKSVVFIENRKKINYENGKSKIEKIKEKQKNNKDTFNNTFNSYFLAETVLNRWIELLSKKLLVGNLFVDNQKLSNINIKSNIIKDLSIKKRKNDGLISIYKDEIEKQIEYNVLYERYGEEFLDPIVDTMYKVLNSPKDFIRISKVFYSAAEVKKIYKSINALHIIYLIDSLNSSTKMIKNINAYLKTSLYNAPITMDIKTLNQVRATYFDIEDEEVDEEYMHDKPIFSENTNNLIDNELDKENSDDLKEKEALNLSEEKKIDFPAWEEYKDTISPGEKTFLECFVRDIELTEEGFYLIVDEKFSKRVIKEKYLNKINLFFEKRCNQKIDVCLRL